jgi:hypothetical protein
MAVTHDFDCEPSRIYELLTDPEFLVDRCLAMGELSAECEVLEEEGLTTIELTREVSRDLPKVLAKLFDSVQMMDMKERWEEDGDGYSGNWTMEVRKQPVTISARFRLVTTAGGCRYTVNHSAKAKILLVGKQVEKYILGQTAAGARDELDYLAQQL